MRIRMLKLRCPGWAVTALLSAMASISGAQVWEKTISPGVTYRMEVDLATPRIIHSIRYSLGAPMMSMKSELAGGTVIEENATKGRETISEMQTRTGALVAVNGDFFPFTGDPLGVMIRDGQLLSVPGVQRATFAWNGTRAQIGLVEFKGTVESGTQSLDIKGLNEECPLNEMVLNTDVAAFALAKTPNIHAVIRMDSPTWQPNGTYTGTFESLYSDAAKLPIQPGNAVLTANGTKAEALKGWIPGQKVTIRFESKGFDWKAVEQLIGGGPFLIRNGQVSVDAKAQGFADSFSLKRHPRTAMGRTANGDIWLTVIDGRQKMSDGATLDETAKIMLKLGCIDAINLDGGGSSSVNILGVTLNRPSDGKERPVANGVVLMGPKPEGTANPLKLKSPAKVTLGQAFTLTVSDDSGKTIPNSEVLWSSQGDAWIDQGGLARPVQKGQTEIVAYARGQILRTTLEITEPEKKAVSKSRLQNRTIASRGKKGRGSRKG